MNGKSLEKVRNSKIAFVIPLLLPLLLYYPALHFSYVWDDWLQVGAYAYSQEASSLIGVLQSPLPFSVNYFRPLTVASFFVESRLVAKPGFSHGLNILLHCFNCVLVALLVRKFWEGRVAVSSWAAALVAGVYALHPALMEGVVWVSGRFDLMMTSCVLLALLAELHLANRILRAGAVSLLFLAALFCKEMAIVFPVLLLLLHLGRSSRPWSLKEAVASGLVHQAVGLSVALLIYVGIRISVLGYFLTTDPQQAFVPLGGALQRSLLVGLTFVDYLEMLLQPFGTTGVMRQTVLPVPLDSLKGWIGLGLLGIAVPAAFVAFARKPAIRPVLSLILAVLVALLPVLHLKPGPMLMANTFAAERATLLPLALLAVCLGPLASRLSERPRQNLLMVIGGVLWLSLSVAWVRVALPAWSNDRALWRYMNEFVTDCSYCQTNLSREYLEDDPAHAVELAKRGRQAAQQPWQEVYAISAEANAEVKMGNLHRAEALLNEAIAIDPTDREKAKSLNSLARLYLKMGARVEAHEALVRAAQLLKKPDLEISMTLILMALEDGQPEIAEKLFDGIKQAMNSATRDALSNRIKAQLPH